MTAIPVPHLVPTGLEELERRARALAAGAVGEDDAAGLLRVVTFRLGGRPCAVDADAVERAVTTLARPFPVPLAAGGERPVAFVEERPLPVADLAGHAAGAPRAAAALEGRPALVVPTSDGPVAVVVEGPLELADGRVVATAPDAGGEAIRVAGLLSGGAALVDRGWLAAWAGRAVRP